MTLGNHHIVKALLNHSEGEIARLGLGPGQHPGNPIRAMEANEAVYLTDGLGNEAECTSRDAVTRWLGGVREGLDF